ncbi:Ig-like domain-containing protein [Jeotgalibacillus malaysiensis]|uniref:Ig-like domain-containing protein n=1 Tax=Jeotgalibacillus malaysiensis TaxID=1508404 RepID=UPI003850E498
MNISLQVSSKQITAILLAFLLILSFGVFTAKADSIPGYFSEPEDLGEFVTNAGTLDSAYGIEDGREVLYTTVTGDPALFSIIDLQTNELISEIPLTGGGQTWGHVVDGNGLVYITSGRNLFVYDPAVKQVENLGNPPGSSTIYGLAVDENNVVYGGTYPTGQVFKYDPVEGEIELYEAFGTNRQYVQDVAYYDGNLFAGTATVGGLFKMDPETGERVYIPFPEETGYTENDAPGLFRMQAVNEFLFIHMSSTPNLGLIYDMKNDEWVEVIENYRSMYVTPEIDGKTYYIAENKFVEFDLSTKVSTPTDIAYGLYFRHGTWIEVEGDPELPGKTLATIASGSVKLINFETGVIKDRAPVVSGTPISVQAMEFGPDGLLYMGGYHGSSGTRYNIETGETERFSMGQTEGMTPYGDKMMFGVYAGAQIYELDPALPISENNPYKIHDIEEDQDRPFAMTTGDGYLFAGTISKGGTYGGAISIFDGVNWDTHRNVVEDQSVMGLAYQDGKLFGSTTIWNGLGIEPKATEAKMFVWDVENDEKIAEFVPDIQLADGQKPKAIGSLSAGPDGNIWGAAYGTIFALDPDTYEVVKQKEIISTNWNFSHLWSPVKLRWEGSLLYTTLGSQIVVIDTDTMEHQSFPGTRTNLMVIGDDGHIYYSEASMLKRIRVVDDVNAPVQTEIDIKNADFEMEVTDGVIPGWRPFIEQENTSLEISGDFSLSGNQSLRMLDQSTSKIATLESDLFSVTPGQKYTIGVSYYLSDPPENPAGGNFSSNRSLMQVRYYDENKELIQYTSGLGTELLGPLHQWQVKEFSVTPIEEAAYMTVHLGGSTNWVSNVYYDDVYVSTEAAPEVVSIGDIEPITVAYGTTAEQLNLPSSVRGVLSNGNEIDMNIEWEISNSDYDATTPGNNVIYGEPVLPEGIMNQEALKASVEITVLEKQFGLFKKYYLIENADFEKGYLDGEIPGWRVVAEKDHTSLELTDSISRSGEYSLSLKDATTVGFAALESSMIPVVPGKEYTAGASFYLDQPLINPETGTAFSSSRSLFQVRYYDENKEFINLTRGLGIIFDGKLGEWRNDEFTVTPPEGAAFMVVHLASNEAYVSNVYYDNVYVYSMEETEVNSVEKPEAVYVKHKTPLDDVELPPVVTVTLNDQDYQLEVPVVWNKEQSDYHDKKKGTYTIIGELQLPEGINNTANYTSEIEVHVTHKNGKLHPGRGN